MAEEPEKESTDTTAETDGQVSAEPKAEKAAGEAAPKTDKTETAAGEAEPKAEKAEAPEGEAAPGAEAEKEPAAAPAKGRSRSSRTVTSGIVHIRATFNNTMVSITDTNGGVVSWSTAGRAGFKGSRKSTAFAATLVGQDAARQAVGKGMREVEVRVQGAGAGRESAIRALQSSGLNITLIKDVTPMPHNGCRARKRRRV